MNIIYRGKTSKEFFLASLLYDSIEDQDLGATASLLKEKEADPNIVLPKKGIAPFHLVIGSDSDDFALEVTKLILQNKGNPNVRSDEGLTPVHIAAAWGRLEVLRLLLSNGGDPDVYDCSQKTPIDYALEENFPECLQLLKLHSPDIQEFFTRNDTSNKYSFVFDKVLVDNGMEIAEYEMVTEDMPHSINDMRETVETLQALPETKSSELVRNWCNQHQEIGESVCSRVLGSTGDTPMQTDCDSSLNESEDGLSRPFDLKNISFKKVYRKTRKVRKNLQTPEKSPIKTMNLTDLLKILETDESADNSRLEFSKMSMYSKESGINTLTDSFRLSDHYANIQQKLITTVPKDTSSDYMTCSFKSEPNLLEKNVFHVTDELTRNQSRSHNVTDEKHLDEGGKSLIPLEKLEKSSSTELSFVSVSEVYKYEDKEEGIVLYERRFLKSPSIDTRSSIKSDSFNSKLSSLPETVDYDVDTLRKELTSLGFLPGPITKTTKQVYLKKLRQLKKRVQPIISTFTPPKKSFSVELVKTLRDSNWLTDLTPYKYLEDTASKEFENPDPSKKWREGVNKTSFTYLLLDPRITDNLPHKADTMKVNEIWETFLTAIFYVGKGKRNRPYAHLYEAISLWNQGKHKTDNKKLQKILDIWKENHGVVCLHIFQNIIPVEAYTREAAMLQALKLENVENSKPGDYYGIAATWTLKQKKMLGVYLLYKAMKIFLHEGERQLCPTDID